MRRINQNYLLATQTSVDVSAVKVPENVNDDYFKVRNISSNERIEFEHLHFDRNF